MITKKRLAYTLLVLVAMVALYEAALYLFLNKNPKYFQVDRCLDSGGCWDGIDNVCRKTEPNAQELCDRSKIEGKTIEKNIEEKIDKINTEH